jgi:ATP-binding cassette subfamily B protein
MQNKHSIDQLAIQHFWHLCRGHKWLFLQAWLTPVPGIGIGVIIPLLIGKIIGSLTQAGADQFSLIVWLVITCLLTVVFNLVAFKAFFELQARVMSELETESLNFLLKRGISFHANRISGKLVSDTSDYTAGFMQLTTVFFVDMLPFATVVVFGSIFVAAQSPVLGLILALMTGLIIVWTFIFRQKMKKSRKKRQAAGKEVIGHIADTIVNNQTVKTFGNENYEMRKQHKLNDRLMQLRIHDWVIMSVDGGKRMGILFLFEILFVIVLVYEVHHNPALLATGIFAFSYTVMLSNRLFQIGQMMRQVEESLLQITPMAEILHEAIEIVDEPDAPSLKTTSNEVAFNDVAFRYEDNALNDTVFQNLNITIHGAEKVGLVGPSGGGKTTLTKLLLRFDDVTSGTITIDGQNIAGVTQESLRRAIAYVSQEPLLFHRSIHENIAYANPDASKDRIHEAARRAYADEFIQKLPNGYDTVVGERGVKLSGGQRQRIAIARAILKEAPILVLDEATSALDSASEKLIQAALTELMNDKTAIVIAHRLSTIQRLDRIIVLDEGQIVEQGTHQQLLAQKGLYATLWAHQSGGFIEE